MADNISTDPLIVKNTLEEEIIVVTTTTLTRLFELDTDAAALYMFYVLTAKRQANQIGYTNQIKCSRSYCLKGLQWGTVKFNRSKKFLVDNGFISSIKKTNQNHTVASHYVQLNYLPKSHSDEKPGVSFQPKARSIVSHPLAFDTTNADKLDINAVNTANADPNESQSEGLYKSAESHSKSRPIVKNDVTKPIVKKFPAGDYKAVIAHIAAVQGLKMLGNYGKQMKFVKLLFDAGYAVTDIQAAVTRMREDDYWKRLYFDASNVYNNIHKYEQPKILSKEEQMIANLEKIDSAEDVLKRLERHE